MTRGNAPAMLPGSVRPSGYKATIPARDPTGEDDVDFFPTQPWGGRAGAEIIRGLDPRARSVWEPACGAGHLAHGLADYFPRVMTSDVCRYDGNRRHDFLGDDPPPFRADWIVTNPPFDHVEDFFRRAWALADRGVAMLWRAACMEGQARHPLLDADQQLTAFAPFSERLAMHRGFWDPTRTTATAYAWFIWCKPGVGPRLPVVMGKARALVIHIPPGSCSRLTRPDDAARFAAREGGA
jgi:hypothetical protein